MKRVFVLSVALFMVCGYAVMAQRSGAGSGQTEVIVQRTETSINAGFKERIYIDGKQQLVLTNGESGTIIVQNGDHTISADLSTLSTGKVPFTAQSRPIKFTVTPYSLREFKIEREENYASQSSAAASSAASAMSSAMPPAMSVPIYDDGSVEGSLLRAAGKIMEKISPQSRIAIVYVTASDSDITEFIANELEFIMVERGLTLIDRSQMDRIRQEQNFQISGEVDDAHAVSLGKIAGADVIITGAVTGSGDLRRLRLRVLNTQTGQVLTVASEKY
jgi:hypothetical protein